MFTDRHYVPALRWRQGEREGLKELRPAHKAGLTPLIDISPIPWNFEDERPSKTIDRHLEDVPAQMLEAWGEERPLFVDLGLLPSELRMSNNKHPVDDLFERLDQEGVPAIPVTGTDRDVDYHNAVILVNARDQNGIAVRLTTSDIVDIDALQGVNELISDLGVDVNNIDLILDLRTIEQNQSTLLRSFLGTVINQIPHIAGYRTFTLLCGAFPVNLSSITQGVTLIPRADWTLWLSLRSISSIRQPIYGDYTATNPDQEEIDPRIIQMSAAIRYASDTDWVICKGRSVRNPKFGGFGQYNTLSVTLRAHPLFTGHSFSWASDFIEQCAGGGRTGNAMIWRKVATNRHMSRVAHQIANLP